MSAFDCGDLTDGPHPQPSPTLIHLSLLKERIILHAATCFETLLMPFLCCIDSGSIDCIALVACDGISNETSLELREFCANPSVLWYLWGCSSPNITSAPSAEPLPVPMTSQTRDRFATDLQSAVVQCLQRCQFDDSTVSQLKDLWEQCLPDKPIISNITVASAIEIMRQSISSLTATDSSMSLDQNLFSPDLQESSTLIMEPSSTTATTIPSTSVSTSKPDVLITIAFRQFVRDLLSRLRALNPELCDGASPNLLDLEQKVLWSCVSSCTTHNCCCFFKCMHNRPSPLVTIPSLN